jgi:hypothetical protein
LGQHIPLACEEAALENTGQFFESIAIACTRRQKRHQSDRFQQMLRIGSRHVKNQPFLVVLATASFGQGIILKLEKAGLLCFLKTIKSFFGVRPRRDHHGLDLIYDALPFGRLWYTKVGDAVGTPSSTAIHMIL